MPPRARQRGRRTPASEPGSAGPRPAPSPGPPPRPAPLLPIAGPRARPARRGAGPRRPAGRCQPAPDGIVELGLRRHANGHRSRCRRATRAGRQAPTRRTAILPGGGRAGRGPTVAGGASLGAPYAGASSPRSAASSEPALTSPWVQAAPGFPGATEPFPPTPGAEATSSGTPTGYSDPRGLTLPGVEDAALPAGLEVSGKLRVALTNLLWSKFNQHQTEMIITKQGR